MVKLNEAPKREPKKDLQKYNGISAPPRAKLPMFFVAYEMSEYNGQTL